MHKRNCNDANFQASMHGIKLSGTSDSEASEVKFTEEQDDKMLSALKKRVTDGN